MSGIRLFAGANTAQGFYSFFEYLAQDDLQRVVIIKGAPGTGKSTLMRKIIEAFPGKKIDQFYCSSDASSLDGIYIREYAMTLMDGTAPHTTDPRLPGAVQEIVDLGRCWSNKELVRRREEIRRWADSKSDQYTLAYKWLALASQQADIIQSLRKPVPPEQVETDVQCIAQLLPTAAGGRNIHAFATAITGNGYASFLPELARDAPVSILLGGGNRDYNNILLQAIITMLQARKVPAIFLHCSLQPQYVEHIYIPGVLGIFSHRRPHDQLSFGLRFGPPELPESELEKELAISIQRATEALCQAQQSHSQLEKIYIPQVDFACVEEKRQRILATIAQLKSRSE